MSEFLKIRNWAKWQSYRRDRGQPPWIKVHREVMRNPDWVALTDAQRGQLVAIWLLAADRDGVIPASPALIRKLCYMDETPDLQVLVKHGFIEPDANVTSERRQGDEAEAEAEAEKKQNKHGSSSDSPAPKTRQDYTSEFESVWSIHGRGAKRKAFDEYRKAVPKRVTHEQLTSNLREYVRSFDDGFNGAHLFRWIKEERWEEHIATNGTKDLRPVRFY